MYLLEEAKGDFKHRVQLLGSGTILREVRAAVDILAKMGVGADVWSVTSFNRRAVTAAVDRWNRLHRPRPRRATSAVHGGREGPVIASTDYMKLFADQIRQWVPSREYGARH